MKKFLQVGFFITFTVIFYLTISKVSGHNYNVAVYGGFVVLISYLFFRELKQFYRARKGTICNGVITDVSKIDESSDPDYRLDIKFISPVDGKEYTINTKISHLPPGKFVDIMFNEENPGKSTVYDKPTPYRLVLYIASILFFCYQLLSTIDNG